MSRPLSAVDDEQNQIRTAHGLASLERAEHFRSVFLLGFSAQAGRVHEDVIAVMDLKLRLDGVHRRPGHRRNQHALLAEQTIAERTLSGVGFAQNPQAKSL